MKPKEQKHVFIYPINCFEILNVPKESLESLSSYKLFFLLLRWCFIGDSNTVKSSFHGANITTEGRETVESPEVSAITIKLFIESSIS